MNEELATIQKLYDLAIEFVVKYSFQILGAIVVLIVGLKVASWLANLTVRFCEKHNLDVTLSKFLGNMVKVLTVTFVIIITIGKFGISIAPFIAAAGAVAFGASFAIQGPLSNYGAGLSIIITRPFVVGNTITVQGVSGVVEEVRLAATILSTEDGEEITIPNKHIVGEIIHNSFANKVIEMSVGIAYASDPRAAIQAVRTVLENNQDVCQDPAPQVGIEEFADSSINIGLRYWVPTKKYFQTNFLINEAIFEAFNKQGINIPFPQRDVRIIEAEEGGRDKLTV
jgi:small conductance mechanosensitive channel